MIIHIFWYTCNILQFSHSQPTLIHIDHVHQLWFGFWFWRWPDTSWYDINLYKWYKPRFREHSQTNKILFFARAEKSTDRLPEVAEQAWRKNGYAVAIVSGYLGSSNLGMRWNIYFSYFFLSTFPMLRRVFICFHSLKSASFWCSLDLACPRS